MSDPTASGLRCRIPGWEKWRPCSDCEEAGVCKATVSQRLASGQGARATGGALARVAPVAEETPSEPPCGRPAEDGGPYRNCTRHFDHPGPCSFDEPAGRVPASETGRARPDAIRYVLDVSLDGKVTAEEDLLTAVRALDALLADLDAAEQRIRDEIPWTVDGAYEAMRDRLAAAEAARERATEALAYVVAWTRHGEGDEATAAEMADAVLAGGGGHDG